MYASAFCLVAAGKPFTYSRAAAGVNGIPIASLNRRGRAVQTPASSFLSIAHARMRSQDFGWRLKALGANRPVAISQNPMSSADVSSRSCRSAMAWDNSLRLLKTWNVVTSDSHFSSITNVKQQARSPLREMRENSIQSFGPPGCHSPTMGKSRGSLMSDPQPRMAIFICLFPRRHVHEPHPPVDWITLPTPLLDRRMPASPTGVWSFENGD